MKHRTLKATFACLILSAPASTFAKINLGPTVSFGHTSVTNTGSNKPLFQPAYGAGIAAVINRTKHNKVGLELVYSAEGYKGKYRGYALFTRDSRVSFIRFTLKEMFLFRKPEQILRPYLYIGPSVGVKIGETLTSDALAQGGTVPSNLYHAIDIGLKGGAGLMARLNARTRLTADIAYYRGITGATDGPGNAGHHNNITLSAALLFRL